MSDRETGVEAARARLGALVNDAAVDGTVTYLTRRGRRFAAIVPLDRIKETAEQGPVAEPSRDAEAVTKPVQPSPMRRRPGRADAPPEQERPQPPVRDETNQAVTESERERWEQEAERERRQFQARLKPVPEFGEGYQMAEWPGTGRYYLVYEGERIGHATKKPFTSRWEAHTAQGATVPGGGTYKTRRDALIQVALHHQQTTRERPKKRR